MEENKENQVQAQGLFFCNKKEEVNGEWFWKNGLSIDESKMSTLIMCLLICMVFAGINYVAKGDITNNLTQVITALIYAIAGVNVTNSILNNTNIGRGSQVNQQFNQANNGNPLNPMNQQNNGQALIPPGVTSTQGQSQKQFNKGE